MSAEAAAAAYTAHKHLLQDAIRRHGASYFALRAAPKNGKEDQAGAEKQAPVDNEGVVNGNVAEYAGLLNQGATCYLNSLLQTLFMLPEFRNAVLASTSTSPVLAELKGLFARLLASTQAALSTKGLTTAFGWSSAEVFQQHDVQELCRILFDGLEASDEAVGQVIREQFAGDMSDTLSCPKCGSVRKNQTTFFDVQLEIQGKSSVQEALNAFLTPEVLDEDNKWMCEACSERVQATKTFTIDRWPPIVTLHLKRFNFDVRTMRRVKLFDEISIPQSINLSEFSSSSEAETIAQKPPNMVDLVAILIQSGTAQGGHYYAYIKDVTAATPRWWEFNDAIVRPMDEEEIRAILEIPAADAETDTAATAATTEGDDDNNVVVERKNNKHAASNAYMLLYRQPSPSTTAIELDQATKELIESENDLHKSLVLAYSFQRMLTNLRVFHHFGAATELRSFGLDVLSATTLADVVSQAREQLISDLEDQAPADLVAAPLECFRLRRFNNATSSPGETFGGKENQSLQELGLCPNATLLLEVRSPDQKFEEFDPSDLHVFLHRWDAVARKVDYGAGVRTLTSIPGKMHATVANLATAAREVFELGDKPISILKLAGREAVVLDDPKKELWKDFRVASGDLIVVEEQEIADSAPQTLQWFREQFTSISVQYNHPNDPQIFGYVLQTSLDQTLRQLLEEIAGTLELPVEEIHVRRNANAPQLKDLDKSLDKLGIVDNSALCVCEGPTLPPTQHLIEFVIVNDAQDKKTPLCELPLDENVRILDVKEILAEKMQLDKTHIRLRHPSTRAIIRDDRRLSRVLLNIHDGMQLLVQALSSPEIIGKDDLIVEVREIDYLRKTILKGKDVVLPKAATTLEMFERVLQAFPHLTTVAEAAGPQESEDAVTNIPPAGQAENDVQGLFVTAIPAGRIVHIAKAYSHGPPLTLKSASKLKWNDAAWLDAGGVSEPPLSLRDGSVLVVRNEQAYERAKAAARARLRQQQEQQEQEGGEVRPPATASKFGRLRTRVKDQPQPRPAKEHALKIDFSAP